MRELELDGIHDDGEHVILVDSDGERYTLRVDRALRAAVRTDRPALGMIQAADAAPLRPREIQTMLRSGRSAEDIAESAEIPLEHVRRYEGPVLAEREWAAQRARTFPVGRGGPSLDDVVAERLAAREATEETAWDAWRRADGTWTLELTFSAAGRTRQAHWVAELVNRSVAPIDDEARWISDEDAPPEPTRGRARLQAVKSSVYDLEADGSFDERSAAPRRGRAPWAGDRSSALEESDLESLNARRGLRSVPPPVDDSATVWTTLDAETTEAEGSGELAPRPLSSVGSTSSATSEVESDREALLEHSTTEERFPEHHSGSASSVFLSPVAESSADEAPQGDASYDGETGAASESELHYQDTVDLTPLPGLSGSSPSTTWKGPASEGTPSSPAEAASSTAEHRRAEDRSAAESSADVAPSSRADEPGGSDASQKPVRSEKPEKPAKASKSRSKRASMPSWDEIVFGSKHD